MTTTSAVADPIEPALFKQVARSRILWCAIFGLVLSVPIARAEPVHPSPEAREAFLSAVAEVETGGNARAVGRQGERGLYQFNRVTWGRYTKRPLADAHRPGIAHVIAVKHYNWLCERLQANGRPVTTYRLAMAWNGGVTRGISGKAPRVTHDYARRVNNLANLLWSRQAPANLAVAPIETPQPVQQWISLDHPDLRDPAPLVALSDPAPGQEIASEITFTLAPPKASRDAASPAATSDRRLFFATIGE